MTKTDETPQKQLADTLLRWFDATAADLPWRRSPTPYHVWLSEIMLQQTQIDTVLPYYHRFIEAYPTVHDLANASLDDVLKLWEGLGYYARARNMHRTAQIVAQQHDGKFPPTVAGLMKLPGIGRYTAGAVASIAFDVSAPVVDGNVTRVLTRLYDLPDDVTASATKSKLWDIAASLVPDSRAGDFNQALMELGQTTCTPRQPDCAACPVAQFCLSQQRGTQSERPNKPKRRPTPHYDVAAGIIRRHDDRILIAQRPTDGLLGGLWEFPGGKQEPDETLQQALIRELREELAINVTVGALFVKVRHAFTHFKITLHAYEARYDGALPPHTEPQCIEAADYAWVTLDEMAQYSFGKADREVIAALHNRRKMLL